MEVISIFGRKLLVTGKAGVAQGYTYCHEVLDRKPSQRIALNRIDRICKHGSLQKMVNEIRSVNAPMILGCLGGLEATFEHLGVRYQSGLSAAAKTASYGAILQVYQKPLKA
jgi:hypothetical protein